MGTLHDENTRAAIDEQVARLRAEVDQEVSLLQADVKEKIATLLAEVNGKVSALEATFIGERSRLNSQRNALSLVYRLPPELVATILLATLTINEEGEDASSLSPRARILKPILPDTNLVQKSDFKYWNNVPEGLRLCHVSQYWRTVALSLPPLWSHIRVDQNTNPEMLKFVRDNAKQCPIGLDIRNHATESTDKVPNRPFPRLRTVVFRAFWTGASHCAVDLEQTGYRLSDKWKLFTPTVMYLRFIAAKLRQWKYLNDRRRLVLLSFQAEEGDLSGELDHQSRTTFKEVDSSTIDKLKGVARTITFGKTTVWSKYAGGEDC